MIGASTVRGRAAVTVAAVAAAVLLSEGRADACSCLARSTKAQLRSATAVFGGLVERVTQPPETGATAARLGGPILAEIRVEARYKGSPLPLAGVRTASSEDECGVAFVEGNRYLVFARRAPAGTLAADLCWGTTADLDLLDRTGVPRLALLPPPPRPGQAAGVSSRSRALPIGIGAALAAATAAALAATASTRRRRFPPRATAL